MRVEFENENAKITKFELTMHPDFFSNPTVHLEFLTNYGTLVSYVVLCDTDVTDDLEEFTYEHTKNRDFLLKLMTTLGIKDINKIKGSYCRITTNKYGRLIRVCDIIEDISFEVYD